MSLRVVVSLLLAPVAIAAGVATGLATTGPAPSHEPPTRSPPPGQVPVTSAPGVTVSPRTGLVGGEQLRVVLSEFPARVGVQVSECPSAHEIGHPGCVGPGTWLVTDATGSASGTFVAQPTTRVSETRPLTVCTTRCVVAAVESQKFVTSDSEGPATATASVSFEPGGTGGLADASLVDLSWVSPEDGFALASRPCDKGSCAVVARTTNAGTSWTALPPTPAFCTDATCSDAVSGIAFASSTVGYLFGPATFMTTDGGERWQALPGPQVESLAVGGGQGFRIAYAHSGCPGPCNPVLQVAPLGSATWHTVLSDLGYGAGNYLVVSGPDVYVVTHGNLASGVGTQRSTISRSIDGGATFETLTDPCAGRLRTPHVLSALAAAPGGVLEGICTRRAGTGGQYLVSSSDAGATWQLRPLPSGATRYFGEIATASASTIAVATGAVGGSGTTTATLLVTTDGGKSWATAATDTFPVEETAAVAQLGFGTSQVGSWVADPHSVFVSTDGGAHWKRFPFASPRRQPSARVAPFGRRHSRGLRQSPIAARRRCCCAAAPASSPRLRSSR